MAEVTEKISTASLAPESSADTAGVRTTSGE